MREDLRDELYAVLERAVSLEEARIHLQALGFPVQRLNFQVSPQQFWSNLRQLLTEGAHPDGEFRLLRQIQPQFPDNKVLQRILHIEVGERAAAAAAQTSPPPGPPHGGYGPPGYGQYGMHAMAPPPYQQPHQVPGSPWAPAYYPPPHPGPHTPPTGAGPASPTGNEHPAPPPYTVRPHPQEVPTPAPEPQPPTDHHTLVFVAGSHHVQFIQTVQREEPAAQLLFVSNNGNAEVGQVAMLLEEPLSAKRVEILRRTLVDLGAPADLELLQQVHGHRPYLFHELRAQGPDTQPYSLDSVPSITTGHDIAAAVLGHGEGAYRDRLARRRRTVVDRLLPDGAWVELDPLSQTLYDSGVRDGDTLRVSPESTAGAGAPQERIRAILRVKREILRYAQQHTDFFRIDHMDDSEFPTVYDISFDAPGFRPPPEGAPPGSPPMPQNVHTVTILLTPQFPYGAPVAVWQTPVFHPNILGPERPPEWPPAAADAPDGLVCLGQLNRAYRPTMDFGRLCQMLVDIAGYRTYDVRSHNDGGEGWFNARAARWAASGKGEAMIREIGGVPSAPPRENPDGDAMSLRVRALRLRKADVVGDDT